MKQVQARVTLVKATPDADQLIASAGKLCYASDTETILQQDSEGAYRFIKKIMKMGHTSITEHVSFTFFVEGVSRAMTHQLVRHRLASYSQRSQRYVDHDSFDYIMPPQLEGKAVEIDGKEVDAADYFRDTMKTVSERYGKLRDAMGRKGESSNQDARYILPNACETKIFVTMNARELYHFFEERLCERAQWEIRGVAEKMLFLARQACPSVFDKAGPKCVTQGKCPEGKLSCGKFKEKMEKYRP